MRFASLKILKHLFKNSLIISEMNRIAYRYLRLEQRLFFPALLEEEVERCGGFSSDGGRQEQWWEFSLGAFCLLSVEQAEK